MIVKSKKIKFSLIVLSIAMFISCKSNGQSNSEDRPPRDQENGQGERNGPPPTAEEIFEMMDTDKNDLLSESEIKGPLKRDFSKIDINEDGFISREELENAPKPARKERPSKGK